MTTPDHVLVAGASAAGLATVEALRRKGYAGRVTVLGAEPHPPYDRPPLSKQILSGGWEPERARLRPPAALSALNAEFLLGDPATGLDVPSRTVRTASGRVLSADAVVVATGLRPRTLPGQAGLAGVHVLRTLDDALALREDLLSCTRLVVVGDGVLGAEIAATACGMGVNVTLAGPQPAPLACQLGQPAAGLLADLHTERGVELRLGAAAGGLTERHGRVTGVRLETGDVLPADVVVVAFGAAPVTDWLATSGLDLDNGVVCDSRCRAAEGVYAVGDVARWHHETLGRSLRLENRDQRHRTGDRRRRQHPRRRPPLHPDPLLLDRPVRRQDPRTRDAVPGRRGLHRGGLRGRAPLRRRLPPRRPGHRRTRLEHAQTGPPAPAGAGRDFPARGIGLTGAVRSSSPAVTWRDRRGRGLPSRRLYIVDSHGRRLSRP